MINDNIKNLRKSKGLSQEQLATKLHITRQTVSKWENGLSVPDSGMLIQIARELDTSVNVLLEEEIPVCEESEIKALALKLELLNEQFAKKNGNRRRLWRAISVFLCIIALVILLSDSVSYLLSYAMQKNVETIGGADGPASIFVSGTATMPAASVIAVIGLGITGTVGIFKTRKNK